ncbi:hypothetical protein PPL_10346 [Heterostelium album PN500]|uniref:Dolichyl-diphosphooligosaccharide--protein glycosyltransferase subunit 4 n=1 Tax=Heterostelium pallidum (strain ATCC 26659 / Pp 5 / PN500) TaxID=670386 RepID=D3BQ26_HETP5|nr:hypothetical protein PPL_10346 [Heterostelium album PN500]EFA76577.1 hypothetical protein PPL_10346 [Heterostelium album PN500]|eukprot:XP_020428709.1 hypothetical protein PPL_10346 [Heterostelium album PN500]
MITDTQLSLLANSMGAIAMILIVAYHFLTATPVAHQKRD